MANRLFWTGALAGLMGVAMVAGTGGCQMNRKARAVPLTGIEETASLASAPLAVDVENQSGTVLVRVDPKVKTPTVTARPADGRRIKKTDQPWATAALAAQDERRVLRVVAGEAEGAPAEAIIVTVVVPSCDGVRVKNAGGPVTLEGVGGAVSVANADMGERTARITVDTTRDLTLPVSLISTGGDVRCTAGLGTAGRVTLNAPNGHTEMRAKFATRVGGGQNQGTTWTATFGQSDNTITLTADHGNAVIELK